MNLAALADAEIMQWLLAATAVVVAALASIHILLFKSDSRAALGWLAVVLIAPVLGALAYWLMGINRVRRHAQGGGLAWSDQPMLALAAPTDVDVSDPRRAVGYRVTGTQTQSGNSISALYNGEQAYPAMLEAIAAANDEVVIASYIFDRDDTGERFVSALASAQARGVRVAVLLDDVGRHQTLPTIARSLKRSNVPYLSFRPSSSRWHRVSLNLRNHRKILCVDGGVAFVGGMNISDRHCLECTESKRDHSADTHFRIDGPAASALRDVFVTDWQAAGGELPESGRPARQVSGDVELRVVPDGPDETLDHLALIVEAQIAQASRRVRIVTPYFLPHRELIGTLQAAALRGVQVQVLLPSELDWPFVRWALDHQLWELIGVGIDVRQSPPPFDHSKLLLIDDDYLLLGSANLDPRSLRLNYEVGVECFDAAIVSELDARYDSIWRNANAVTREAVRDRSIGTRIRDATVALMAPYL